MKVKQGGERNLVVFEMVPSTTISMKRSRREISIDMVIRRDFLKITKLGSFSVLPSYLPVTRLPETMPSQFKRLLNSRIISELSLET